MKDKEIKRRQFFRQFLVNALEVFEDKEDKNKEQQVSVRPPGALPEEEFLANCEKCGKCVEACPYEVISLFGAEMEKKEKTPFIAPEQKPCRWCTDMPCIKACPSGALAFLEDKKASPIGKVTIEQSLCLTEEGILCDECATVCPTHIRAIRMVNKKPQLNIDSCMGCGLCVFYCQATPVAIAYSPGC